MGRLVYTVIKFALSLRSIGKVEKPYPKMRQTEKT